MSGMVLGEMINMLYSLKFEENSTCRGVLHTPEYVDLICIIRRMQYAPTSRDHLQIFFYLNV